MFEILGPVARLGTLFMLLIAGSIIMQPSFGDNLGDALGNHVGLLIFIGLVWLLWRPIAWAIKLILEGFLLGEGAKWSGVFQQRRPRSRWWR